jgi:trypsin-like peptidase
MLLVCMVCLLLFPNEKSDIDTLKFYEHTREAVVRISATDSAGHSRFGSGVIVRADGVIVTDYHLIDQAATVRVQLFDGTSFDTVTALGSDTPHEVVILKVDATNLPVLKFGYPQNGLFQRLLFIVGSPMDLGPPISVGTLLSVPNPIQAGANPQHLPLIVFNATLLPSNTGGPVLDENGKTVGLVSERWAAQPTPPKVGPGGVQTIQASQHSALPGDYIKSVEEAVLASASAGTSVKKWEGPQSAQPLRSRSEILEAAKSVYVLVERGSADMRANIESGIVRWGGLSISSEPRKADLILLVADSGLVRQSITYSRLTSTSYTSEVPIEALASLHDASTGLELWYTSQRNAPTSNTWAVNKDGTLVQVGNGDFSDGLTKQFIHFMTAVQHSKK